MPRNAVIKALFVRGPSPTVQVVLAGLTSLGLIIADHRFHYLDQLRSALGVVVYPLQFLANQPSEFAEAAHDSLATKDMLQQWNGELRRENLVLKARMQQFDAIQAENIRLRDLLGSSLDLGERVLIAEIMSVDLAQYRQQVMVNKGSDSGAFIGQPVLDANAVMGQVIRATPVSATVLLITDADHALPVEINRNGLRAVAVGTGLTQELDLLYIQKNADVKAGDLVVTSGMDGRFPRGYPVARVKTVRHDPENPFVTVIAEPTARLDRSREVLLVTPMKATQDAKRSAQAAGGQP